MQKKNKSKYQGDLIIADASVACAVLDSGERVISIRSFSNALGVKGGGAYWKTKKENPEEKLLPEFISAKNLEPYITDEIRELLENTISYKSLSGIESQGIKAEIIPKICDIWLEALNGGSLTTKQQKVAKNAHILLSAFAHVGITALVDEATGYQEVREKNELQMILQKYIAKELLPWSLRFPPEFYQEMFRLRDWEYNADSKQKKPMLAGKLTKQLIYDKLPEGVIEEIKKKNPKRKSGLHKNHHHRYLTPDIGNDHLERQISHVTMLMRISPTWKHFERNFQRAFNPQRELDLPDDDK